MKSAAGGLPRSTAETLSAFANGTGGLLILGLAENKGFTPAPSFDAVRIQEALARLCSEAMEPPLRAPIDIMDFEGSQVVVQEIPPLDPLRRPSYVKNLGPFDGAFIRGGDGDRHLSDYEVLQLLSNRSQPADDAEIVPQAELGDLDTARIERYIARARESSPRAFEELTTAEILVRVGAAKKDESNDNADNVHPTLAGLLCFGQYPQQFFPQLFVSFVVLPGLTMGDSLEDGTRFLDNVTCDGPVSDMIEQVIAAARRNMRKAAVIKEVGRHDRFEYPVEVIRELVVNAVLHRDYSPLSRGTQVQVAMYPDRLEVRSPGGLYGNVVPSQLGVEDITSTRNANLARLLADVPGDDGQPISENRGSGLPRVFARLRKAGMSPPTFEVTPSQVRVVVPQHALLDPDTVEWIGSLHADGLNQTQFLALAMMRSTGYVTNEMLRAWGVDRYQARDTLKGLVNLGLAVKFEGRRYATYELAEPLSREVVTPPLPTDSPSSVRLEGVTNQLEAIEQAIRAGCDTTSAITQQLGLRYSMVIRRINALLASGRITASGSRHSRQRRYHVAP